MDFTDAAYDALWRMSGLRKPDFHEDDFAALRDVLNEVAVEAIQYVAQISRALHDLVSTTESAGIAALHERWVGGVKPTMMDVAMRVSDLGDLCGRIVTALLEFKAHLVLAVGGAEMLEVALMGPGVLLKQMDRSGMEQLGADQLQAIVDEKLGELENRVAAMVVGDLHLDQVATVLTRRIGDLEQGADREAHEWGVSVQETTGLRMTKAEIDLALHALRTAVSATHAIRHHADRLPDPGHHTFFQRVVDRATAPVKHSLADALQKAGTSFVTGLQDVETSLSTTDRDLASSVPGTA